MEITTLKCNIANYGSERSVKTIKYIVIHYDGNDGATAKQNAQYFNRESVKPKRSAHFFVDENEIYSSVPVSCIAYHCGGALQGSNGASFHGKCKNANSIGIELCSDRDSKGNYFFTKETMKNAGELVHELMKMYNVPISNVIRHYDVTGKICPAPFISERAWEKFKELIMKGVDDLEKVYKSISEVPDWGKDAVSWAMKNGILMGESENCLNLTKSELRAIVWIYRSSFLK